MSALILNKAGNVPFSVTEANVLKVYVKDSITNVIYIHEEDGYRRTDQVLETPTAIALQSSNLIAVTETAGGSTVHINMNRVNSVYDESGTANILFENEGTNLEKIDVTETAAAVQALRIEKSGQNAYLIDSFTISPDVIILATAVGDIASSFTAGDPITVFGEGDANDAIYTVASAAYVSTETHITVNETPALAQATNGGYVWFKG